LQVLTICITHTLIVTVIDYQYFTFTGPEIRYLL